MMFDWFSSGEDSPPTWGVINDSGQWECFRVSETRAREDFENIHYGKLVRNIRSNNQYEVVEKRLSPHT